MSHQLDADARAPSTGSAETELLARLEALLASAPLGIAFLDRSLRVERVNTALAAVLGRPAAECRGRSVAELIPGLAGVLLPVLGQVVTRGEAVPEFEFSGEAPGSGAQTRHWLSAFIPVRTDGDALAGVGIILRDITARHDASARERRRSHHRMALHSITAALAEAITPREVVAVVVAHAASAFGAVGSVIARRTPDGREVEVPGADGLPSDIAGEWARFPISAPAPLAYVARTGESLFLESDGDWKRHFPSCTPSPPRSANTRTWWCP